MGRSAKVKKDRNFWHYFSDMLEEVGTTQKENAASGH